jgi:hypothetical protein
MAAVEMLEGSDAPSAQFHWNFVKNEEEWLALPGKERKKRKKSKVSLASFVVVAPAPAPAPAVPVS